jgi:hypothetical protein
MKDRIYGQLGPYPRDDPGTFPAKMAVPPQAAAFPPDGFRWYCAGCRLSLNVGQTGTTMSVQTDDEPMFSATKRGRNIQLSRDPHPDADGYLVVEAPGLLVLFSKERTESKEATRNHGPKKVERSDRDAQLRDAFLTLGSRVTSSLWSQSAKPHSELIAGFRALAEQPSVQQDVTEYLDEEPSVANSTQMLFTSLAMSTRADWRSVSAEFRGVAARGWFLGRWIPTFLVLDGPILEFLKSRAFRRQEGSREFLRAVRSFFDAENFMALRHAFAHWSFSWVADGNDSEIVAFSRSQSMEFRVSRKEVDAFHILTFAVVSAINDTFLRARRQRAGPLLKHP